MLTLHHAANARAGRIVRLPSKALAPVDAFIQGTEQRPALRPGIDAGEEERS